jgi:hypothetical protein
LEEQCKICFLASVEAGDADGSDSLYYITKDSDENSSISAIANDDFILTVESIKSLQYFEKIQVEEAVRVMALQYTGISTK